ncbi:MAG: hypothetical protein M4D80_11560 [Myxococcota bacterium]|nr:hypothetical protein [Deltaproteobacteria bacterium]MDQ3335796.1 hypothetical protein [Myxococcota bacterium]
MLKTLTLALSLAAFAGCKTDAPASSEKSRTTEAPSNAKPRSGKIDLPTLPQQPTPNAPAIDNDDDDDRAVSRQAREERRRQRMGDADTNGDGEISDEERQAARAKREQEMKDRLDANKDGVVSEEERNNAMRQRAVDMHARFDKDGDGKVSSVELEAAPFGRFDASADTNNDGQVSVDELDTAIRERRQGGAFRRGRRRGGGSGDPME